MHVMMMVVMMVVVVVMMVVVVVMIMHLVRHRRGRRRGVLSDGVAGEADRESGGGNKGLDHVSSFLLRKTAAVFRVNLPRLA